MALPIDRSTLALAQGNQVPYQVASSTKNINFLKVVADTIDELNVKVDAHAASSLLPHTDESVSTAKLAPLAVTTPKLAPLSVTNEKIANATIDATKFVAGVLTNETANGLQIVALKADVAQERINVCSAPYSADNTGVADSKAAIDAAVIACPVGGTLYIPQGTFKTMDTILINKDINVIMDGTISYAGSKDRIALSIVPTTDYFRYRTYKLSVIASTAPTLTDWANENFIGIYMTDMLYCNVTTVRVENFTKGLALEANATSGGSGFGWNKFYLGRFRDNRNQLIISSVAGGWINANDFYGGSFERSGSFLLTYTGIRTMISLLKSATYGGNSLNFWSPKFEGGATITSGQSRVIYIEDKFSDITFHMIRLEDVVPNNAATGSIAYIERKTNSSPSTIRITTTNIGTPMPLVVSTDGNPILLEDCLILSYELNPTATLWDEVFDSGALIEHYRFGLGGGTKYSFDNCFMYTTSGGAFGTISASSGTDLMDYANGKIGGFSNGAPAVKLSCTLGDHFIIETDGKYIMAVRDLDDLGMNMPLGTEILTSGSGTFTRFGAPWFDYVQSNVTTSFAETEVAINSSNIGYIILGALQNCSYFKVFRYKGNGANRYPQNNNFYSNVIPSGGGNHVIADKVLISSPVASSIEGWVCTTTGTFGTLSSVTGSITTGTKILTVNDATNIKRGMYITIVGVTGVKKVTRVSGTTVYIDSNANATVSGAAVAYSAPVYKTFGVTGA